MQLLLDVHLHSVKTCDFLMALHSHQCLKRPVFIWFLRVSTEHLNICIFIIKHCTGKRLSCLEQRFSTFCI